jgi:peptidoglycan/xylan/chitin deacetylase (PgdA/CDA1 family)
MNYLYKNNYNVISLERLLNLLNSRQKIPKKTVAITFDDGYEDNYSNALPVLRNYNFPAVIFLTTGKIGDKDYINKRGIKMPMLDWSQIEDMHNTDLINFGSHTVSHPRLSKIQIEKAMIEMKNSKYEIETRLNKKCRFFCLPYGDYNVEVINMAREIFELCLTVERGFVSYIDDKFLLKRNSVDSLTTPFIFKLKI